ncbi:hypothetical protein BOO71_0014017 [Deinococcus marmoris]|uniref:Uncharacterized protein n=1 Tax=Deinococcus marmoris TaxID=249408 RepID=A0A1U7NSA1_9DEIO|nr:hypothetical protein BOO71_0014017 [Deinococcus marmoris]
MLERNNTRSGPLNPEFTAAPGGQNLRVSIPVINGSNSFDQL